MKKIPFLLVIIVVFNMCPLRSLAQAGWQWGRTNTSSFNGVVEAAPIATDPSGNVFICGSYFLDDSITFGTHTIYGQSPMFVTKVDSSGNFLWVVGNSLVSCQYRGICTDAAGNVYVSGMYAGNDSFSIGSVLLLNPSFYLMDFIAKISPTGAVQWAKNIVGSQTSGSSAGGIDVSPEGDVYVTGCYNLPGATIGTSTLVNASAALKSDVYIAKYDQFGNPIWAKGFGGSNDDRPLALSVSGSGNVYVTGEFASDTMVVGADTLTDSLFGTTKRGSFVAKFDASGNEIWAKSMNRHVFLSEIKAGLADGSFVTGYFDSTITLGTDTLHHSGLYGQTILVSYDSSGNMNWANSATGTASSAAYRVAPDACGNVWVAGNTKGTLNCDTSFISVPAPSNDPMYIIAYDKCGRYIPGSGHVLGSGADDACGLALAGADNLYVGGDYELVSMIIGPDSLPPLASGKESLLLAKYRIGTMPCGSYSCSPVTTLQTGNPNVLHPEISLFPNPAFADFTIRSNTPFPAGSKAELYDVTGRLLASFGLKGTSTDISVANLETGIYNCRITAGDNYVLVKKLVVIK